MKLKVFVIVYVLRHLMINLEKSYENDGYIFENGKNSFFVSSAKICFAQSDLSTVYTTDKIADCARSTAAM